MNKILVVDSGSTKSDWAFIEGSNYKILTSSGINPASDLELLDLEKHNPTIIDLLREVSAVYYYGAGVIDIHSENRIKNWLQPYLNSETNISVASDLIGACKSVAGDKKGIVSILGTGCNSCTYDGHSITDNIPAMGYVLSNEGAGTDIGKSILRSYFYRKMPADVRLEFESNYQLTKSDVVHSLYQKENPTRYLASFASFLNITENKYWKKSILEPIFQNFIDIRIKSYKEYLSYELYFVGSIAYFCQDILKETLENNNLQSVKIIQKPITGLIEYHKRNEL